jgi:hypothetical protein
MRDDPKEELDQVVLTWGQGVLGCGVAVSGRRLTFGAVDRISSVLSGKLSGNYQSYHFGLEKTPGDVYITQSISMSSRRCAHTGRLCRHCSGEEILLGHQSLARTKSARNPSAPVTRIEEIYLLPRISERLSEAKSAPQAWDLGETCEILTWRRGN